MHHIPQLENFIAVKMGIGSIRATPRVECEHSLLRNMGGVGEGTRLDIRIGFHWHRKRRSGDCDQTTVNNSDTILTLMELIPVEKASDKQAIIPVKSIMKKEVYSPILWEIVKDISVDK